MGIHNKVSGKSILKIITEPCLFEPIFIGEFIFKHTTSQSQSEAL